MPVWLGMAYSRGVMPFNHLVNRMGRTYSKEVMLFNQTGLKGSNAIQTVFAIARPISNHKLQGSDAI